LVRLGQSVLIAFLFRMSNSLSLGVVARETLCRVTLCCALLFALLGNVCPAAFALMPNMPTLDRDLNHPTGTLLYAISAQLASRGELIASEGLLQSATGLLPSDPMVMVTYAYVLEGLGKSTEAINYYEQALAVDSTLYQARYSLAMLLDHQGKTMEGIAQLKKATLASPQNAMMYYDLGVLYARVHNYDQAAFYSGLAADYAPKMAEAFNNQAFALAHLNQLDSALATIEKALALKANLNEKSAAALDTKGFILHKMGRYQAAIDQYQQAIAEDPSVGEIYLHLGQSYEQLNDRVAMTKAYTRYLQLTPLSERQHVTTTVNAKLRNVSLATPTEGVLPGEDAATDDLETDPGSTGDAPENSPTSPMAPSLQLNTPVTEHGAKESARPSP
jgi:tetratricopeptide (TPR) repeat protein